MGILHVCFLIFQGSKGTMTRYMRGDMNQEPQCVHLKDSLYLHNIFIKNDSHHLFFSTDKILMFHYNEDLKSTGRHHVKSTESQTSYELLMTISDFPVATPIRILYHEKNWKYASNLKQDFRIQPSVLLPFLSNCCQLQILTMITSI